MEKETTFGSSPKGMAALMRIAIGGDSKDGACQSPGEVLRVRLDGTLPLDAAVVEALPAILGRLSKQLIPLAGRPLGEVLLDQNIDLNAIKTIKDYGKRLTNRHDSDADDAAGVTIYYAAIASALLFHNEKITQHTWAHLDRSFDLLLNKPWMPPEFLRHFAKARKHCIKKKSG
jgi:hypothetical protein